MNCVCNLSSLAEIETDRISTYLHGRYRSYCMRYQRHLLTAARSGCIVSRAIRYNVNGKDLTFPAYGARD